MAWTEEQEKAIRTEGSNIIVSAGAGSGKTAVLTARVQRKLLEGVHVNELLVLTFTNAAAAEMKDRIRQTIHDTPSLLEEENLLEGAYITTFDAFSLAMVKKYHTQLNVSDTIQISDEVVIDLKKKEILDKIFEENYLSPKKNFMNLIDHFCLKDDEDLKKSILGIYKKIELKYNKEDYLNHYFDYHNIDDYVEEYLQLICQKRDQMMRLIEQLGDYFDGDFVAKVEDNFLKLRLAKNYDDFLKAMDYKSIMVPKNSDESGKKLKQTIFNMASEIKDYCIYDSISMMKDEIESTKDDIEVILSILKEFDQRLENYKREEEIYNFTDIARMAIQVVQENEDIRNELSNQFQEIMVDEYQDTSDTQEMFISLIARNNVYMVGDIKQSIYRFRNANPYLFKSKYDSYAKNHGGIKIDLLKNFRSREEVLADINLLFNYIMDDEIGGANYSESHQMVFGNSFDYVERGKTNQDYHMNIYTFDKKELGHLTVDEEEAFIIASDIQKKIEEKYLVFDKKKKALRPIEYRDFVILLDRSKSFDLYKKIFEYCHIPLDILREQSLKKDYDSFIIRNLFRLLIFIKKQDYGAEFRYVFTSVARSFLYQYTDQEIYELFLNHSFFESSLFQLCLDLSKKMDCMSLSQYYCYVMECFHYEEKLVTIGNVKSGRVRYEFFYNLCCDYEKLGNTIYDFVDYLNQVFDGNYDLKFNIDSNSGNSCKIMTIHKSKGLEFPICYFAGFTSPFNLNELSERVLFDSQYGFVLPKVDQYYKDTILKTLLKKHTKLEEISERIRLLYVAVTRAKEKMVIVMPECEEEQETFDVVPIYEREKYLSFYSIIKSIYSSLIPYEKKFSIIGSKEYLELSEQKNDVLDKNSDPLIVDELAMEEEKIEEIHYSKENKSILDSSIKEKMEFGTKVHAVLEEIDFSHYSLEDYHLSSFVKDKISSFLNSSFMKDRLSMKMYKEYEFIYEEDDTLSHGIIDLLIDEGDSYTIIDYKLKDIQDTAYQKQLNGYRKYIEGRTHKPVQCYLYSIMDEVYQEVVRD